LAGVLSQYGKYIENIIFTYYLPKDLIKIIESYKKNNVLKVFSRFIKKIENRNGVSL
jgi:hypothetical protein